MRSEPSRFLGFTTIELVVTLIVVGIMAFVAIPRLDSLRGYDEAAYRDRVKAVLTYARKAAVAQRRNVKVELSATGLTLSVEQATPEGQGTPGAYTDLPVPGGNTNSIAAPSGILPALVSKTYTFDALGRSNGGNYTVGSTNITVVAETGYAY